MESCRTRDGYVAVVWTETGAIHRLDQLLIAAGVDLRGINDLYPKCISGDGHIVCGDGMTAERAHQGWVADLSGTALFANPDHAPAPH